MYLVLPSRITAVFCSLWKPFLRMSCQWTRRWLRTAQHPCCSLAKQATVPRPAWQVMPCQSLALALSCCVQLWVLKRSPKRRHRHIQTRFFLVPKNPWNSFCFHSIRNSLQQLTCKKQVSEAAVEAQLTRKGFKKQLNCLACCVIRCFTLCWCNVPYLIQNPCLDARWISWMCSWYSCSVWLKQHAQHASMINFGEHRIGKNMCIWHSWKRIAYDSIVCTMWYCVHSCNRTVSEPRWRAFPAHVEKIRAWQE